MKKILGFLFITSSVFSMQLDKIKNNCLKIKTIQQKLIKHYSPKLNDIKQDPKLSLNDTKQCVNSIYVPQGLGKVKLFHDSKGFHVLHNNEMSYAQPCFMDKAIRNITLQQVMALQKIGYFSINQMGNKEFSLKFIERVRGGGPIFGTFMYWATKSLCYGTALTAVGAATIATGGVAVGAITGVASGASGLAVGAAAVSTTTTAAIGTTAGVVVGGPVAGAAVAGTASLIATTAGSVSAAGATIAGVTVVEAAKLTTAAAVVAASSTSATASVGVFGACAIGIEGLSVAIGTFFGMLPTP